MWNTQALIHGEAVGYLKTREIEDFRVELSFTRGCKSDRCFHGLKFAI